MRRAKHAAFGLARDIQQRIQLHGHIRDHVDVHQRFFEVQGHLAVKILVLFLGHILFGRAPERGLFVDRFLAIAHVDRETDVIGMLVDDLLQAIFLGEFGGIFLELDLDLRAALVHFRRADLEIVLAGGVPADRPGARFVGAGGDPHPFRHHEDRIKAHPELADDLGKIQLLVLGGFHEFARPRLGDRPQVLDDLVPGHADAGILDGEQALLLIRSDVDLQIDARVEDLVVGQHLEADAVERVGGIREQFAQKDLPVFVQGMDQDIEQLPGLGLEGKAFGFILAGGWGLVRTCLPPVCKNNSTACTLLHDKKIVRKS